jgi:sodium/hydrogen antiporter
MGCSHLHVSEINVILVFFGLFMMIFMLTSELTQSVLHVGADNVAFIAGIIFGPRAASLLDPFHWHNVDTMIMEITRIVLVTQCFANGVELPKFYLIRHRRSLACILGPAMAVGWLVGGCCVKLTVPSLDWRQSLACAACFNAIDPILAATALQTGLFYKQVPNELRHLLRAEAGFNGVTTTLVLALAIYLLRYRDSPLDVAMKTLSLGPAYDIAVPVALLWYFDSQEWVDRPAFLALYFAMAVFCAGVGSTVGTDEVLLAFIAGYCLDYDDRYQVRTQEARMSETLDLLLNLTFYVFIGSVIPCSSFNSSALNTQPWRLVAGTILLFIVRRLPVFILLKPLIGDFRTMRQAVFYAHFGPIGGGAIFSALLIRAQLTPGSIKNLRRAKHQVRPLRNSWTVSGQSRLSWSCAQAPFMAPALRCPGSGGS